MAVRVKLVVAHGAKRVETVALVNSGFETDTAQLLLPAAAAERLGLWPPTHAQERTYDTAGGPTKVWAYPEILEVKISTEEASSKEVKADLVVSPIEDEALISDILAGELEIVVEDFGKGLWRLRKEKETRESERPKVWK